MPRWDRGAYADVVQERIEGWPRPRYLVRRQRQQWRMLLWMRFAVGYSLTDTEGGGQMQIESPTIVYQLVVAVASIATNALRSTLKCFPLVLRDLDLTMERLGAGARRRSAPESQTMRRFLRIGHTTRSQIALCRHCPPLSRAVCTPCGPGICQMRASHRAIEGCKVAAAWLTRADATQDRQRRVWWDRPQETGLITAAAKTCRK